MKKALFAGSFDPVTLGHKDIVLKALPLFDEVIVAIGNNTEKKTMFSLEQRSEWLKKTFAAYKNVKIDTFDCLTVDYCRENGIKYIIRGLRNELDYSYENNIACINKEIASEIETIFFASDIKKNVISSSFVREMILYKKDVSKYIPEEITIE